MNSAEYWLKYDEDTDDYTHFNSYKNVNPSFIYPLNQEVKCMFLGEIIYKFNGLSNEEKEIIKKADENSKSLVKLQNEMRWMGKCCSIKISTATGSNEGRLFLRGGFATTFVGFCKDLSLSENIPDWKAKQLVDILALHLEKLRAEINDLDQEDIKLACTDIENIAKKFNFYLLFMKKRGVDIAEYLQLLEGKM
jgi:hypothetical protein